MYEHAVSIKSVEPLATYVHTINQVVKDNWRQSMIEEFSDHEAEPSSMINRASQVEILVGNPEEPSTFYRYRLHSIEVASDDPESVIVSYEQNLKFEKSDIYEVHKNYPEDDPLNHLAFGSYTGDVVALKRETTPLTYRDQKVIQTRYPKSQVFIVGTEVPSFEI